MTTYTDINFQAWDTNNLPLAGGILYTYQSQSDIPSPTYTQGDGVSLNGWPLTLDEQGTLTFALADTGPVRFNLTDAKGVQMPNYPIDGFVPGAVVEVSKDIPVITVQPVDSTVSAGSSAYFSVTAVGANLNYQWFKDSLPVEGATQTFLSFGDAQPENEGSYFVVVSTLSGEAVSDTVTLTVNTTITANFLPQDYTTNYFDAIVGDTITLIPDVTATHPYEAGPFTYNWSWWGGWSTVESPSFSYTSGHLGTSEVTLTVTLVPTGQTQFVRKYAHVSLGV